MLTIAHDLLRLRSLLGGGLHALAEQLIDAFGQVSELSADSPQQPAALSDTLKRAVTGMQMQDMSEQLIDHMQFRLSRCSDLLADAMLGDAQVSAPPPLPPCPVARDDRDGGSVELF